METFFALLGFAVSQEGVVTTTTFFARLLSDMLVADKQFVKLNNNTYIKI